jgi:hypothetical protein
MKHCIVCAGSNGFVVVFKQGDDIVRTDQFPTWAAATRAMLGWI